MQKTEAIPLGIKIIIAFLLLNAVAWTIGQGGAVIAYDTVAEWGLQDPREALNPAIVEVNRGIGLTDIIVQIPLYLIASIGLLRLRFYGAVASWLVLGTTLYWPVVFWSSQYFYGEEGIKYQPTAMSAHLILSIILLIAVWAIVYLYRNRDLFKR